MKYLVSVICLIAIVSCENSEGVKFGLLQKVSHKTFPCDYYEIQVAFEGGKMVGTDKNSSFENTQDIKIDKPAFDSLQKYVGDKIIFDYKDDGVAMCGSSKYLTSLKVK